MSVGTAERGASGAVASHPLCALIPGFVPPADGHVRGVVVAGVDDPAFVRRVLDALPACADGYETPVDVVEPREREAAALRASMGETARVRLHSGADAVARFVAARRAAIGTSLPRHVIRGSGGPAPAWLGELVRGIEALVREQQTLDAELRGKLRQRWAARGMAHWAARFAALRAGKATARVMIVTSRYSTFVRHAADDLAQAVRGLGHHATVLMEPDAHATLTSCFYLDMVDRFDPDLIVGINYPRSAMGDALPDGWPYVCWVQDAMPHLFAGGGPRATALDFVAGHVYAEALERLGYARERVLEHPVSVSPSKFHAGAVDASARARFECEIAYVSHRSETPAAFHERFVRESGMRGPALAALERARERAEDVIRRWPTCEGASEIAPIADQLAAELGKRGDARVIDMLRHQYVAPLAEQLLRHETLEWAATIARENGLRLRVFGKGWERHPTLAEFAGGELGHGDELRACYQLAACHLHASLGGCGHQRVAECAMSGGVALCRRSWAELYFHDWVMSREFVKRGLPPDVCLLRERWPAHFVADHPELMQMVRMRQRLPARAGGWDHAYLDGLYAQVEYPTFKPLDMPVPAEHARPISIMGDALECTFSTRDELRERVLMAAARGEWRRQVSSGVARRAVERIGTPAFARRVIELVGGALGAGAVTGGLMTSACAGAAA
jgi:hypothetical protein